MDALLLAGGGLRAGVCWLAQDGVMLDFNVAYNPPCVFTEFATCPRPMSCNKLPISVEAGEKMYTPH